MKRNQLIKKTRDIPDELILPHLEYGNYRLADYFLVKCADGSYARGMWQPDGKPGLLMFFGEQEVTDFAIEQFLLRHVPVYESEEDVPLREPSGETA